MKNQSLPQPAPVEPQPFLEVKDVSRELYVYCNVCGIHFSGEIYSRQKFVDISYSANGYQSHSIRICENCAGELANKLLIAIK